VLVDEDYLGFGLSGEIAAVLFEQGIRPAFVRVCTEQTIPYSRELEDRVLPNAGRIVE
jgi:pyruvate/2-oxoglutarate/acetoin dehydrogenase E1 component